MFAFTAEKAREVSSKNRTKSVKKELSMIKHVAYLGGTVVSMTAPDYNTYQDKAKALEDLGYKVAFRGMRKYYNPGMIDYEVYW